MVIQFKRSDVMAMVGGARGMLFDQSESPYRFGLERPHEAVECRLNRWIRSPKVNASIMQALASFEGNELTENQIVVLTSDIAIVDQVRAVASTAAVVERHRDAIAWLEEHLTSNRKPPVLILDLDCPGDLVAITELVAMAHSKEPAPVIVAINRYGLGVIDDALDRFFKMTITPPVTASAIAAALEQSDMESRTSDQICRANERHL